MGPLSGLIVAPVVGVLSDRCTSRFGRRRPFMLGGVIFCIIGMLVFAKADELTLGYKPAGRLLAVLAFGVLDFSTNAIMFPSRALLGDLLPPDQQHPVQSAAAVVASLAEICGGVYLASWKDPVTNIFTIFVVASVLLAVSSGISLIVCKETPMRPREAEEGNSVEMENMEGRRNAPIRTETDHETKNDEDSDAREEPEADNGKQVSEVQENEVTNEGNEHSRQEVAVGNTAETKSSDDLQVDSMDGSGTKEEEPNDEDIENRLSLRPREQFIPEADAPIDVSANQASVWGELTETVKTTLMNFPRPLVKIGIVYGLAWFLWFASLPFYSQWLGVDVLGGDPRAAPGSEGALQYQKGVSVFSVANAVKAALAMVFSAFYPSIIKWVGAVGERVVFGLSFLLFSSVLFSFAYTKNVVVAACVIALGSVPFIVTQTIPIALVVQRYPENLASNLGVLNLFCVVPQLLDTLYTGKIAEVASESAVLRVAAGWGFAAAIAAVCFL